MTRPTERDERPIDPAVRGHHRRRHGAGELHPAGAAATSGPRARRCSWPTKMGLDPAMVVHAKQMGDGLHVLRRVRAGAPPGRPGPGAWWSSGTTRCSSPRRSTRSIRQRLRRKLVVVGACIGTDAHTVGIDAILNLKGIAGEKGLEYYREFKVVNLGAQVTVPELVERARAERADAVLVSQVVTQRDAHLHNTREMSAAFREAFPAERRPLLVVGGPRFDELADRRARAWTGSSAAARRPREVASYLVHALITKETAAA